MAERDRRDAAQGPAGRQQLRRTGWSARSNVRGRPWYTHSEWSVPGSEPLSYPSAARDRLTQGQAPGAIRPRVALPSIGLHNRPMPPADGDFPIAPPGRADARQAGRRPAAGGRLPLRAQVGRLPRDRLPRRRSTCTSRAATLRPLDRYFPELHEALLAAAARGLRGRRRDRDRDAARARLRRAAAAAAPGGVAGGEARARRRRPRSSPSTCSPPMVATSWRRRRRERRAALEQLLAKRRRRRSISRP